MNLIFGWLDLRNKAAHGKYSEYNENQVKKMIMGVRDYVHNLEEFFDSTLKIEISSIFSEWDSFIENFYRRHVIID
ncbi:hypothetical protein LCGC14_0957320 [marine sediment metagenome]|uniref:Apea-like HEPN domain-containing protein n=1 Tax=marine sediment metagenome TaxID=412755 RepID=A0A0F9NK76_9ZZZZ